jgi:hypothetical protein
LDAPSVRDASRYSVSTLLIPVIVLYNTGKKEHMKTNMIGNNSLIPIHNMNRGIQPSAGMGIKRLNTGEKASSSFEFNPINMPTKMPLQAPNVKPIITRKRLLARLSSNIPSIVKKYSVSKTVENGGNR